MSEGLTIITGTERELKEHCFRVGALAYELSESINLDQNLTKQIRLAGLLHDLGKRKLDPNILFKVGSLTKEEIKHLKTHVQHSLDYAKKLGYKHFVTQAIYQHHESFDGSGYPRGLSGDQISIGGRILKICDVFDALTSDRAYRKALDTKTAIETMDRQLNEFDPIIYKLFKLKKI